VSAEHVEARPGAYADSVTLMQVSADVQRGDEVHAALIAMATELNVGLAAAMGFDPPGSAGPNDLLIAIRASDESALSQARAAVDAALTARPPLVTSAGVTGWGAANVPVEQEIRLKDTAAQRDLLVMGPDCGTAVVGGVGLGFANAVAAGPVGLVAASGTGAQQVLCLLDYAGTGVSAALGVGGRDLSAAVGGRSARAALATLDADAGTDLIVVVSKPPDPGVAAALRDYAASLHTPVQFAFVGPGAPDLTAATEAAVRALDLPVPTWPQLPGPGDQPRAGLLRGLFAGGTLCDEAMVIATERLGPILSNIPLRPELRLAPLPAAGRTAGVSGHAMFDFGDDELTVGRAHPMIDQSLRLERLAAEADDLAVAVLLLDVVLGHGAHPDPAAELGPAIAAVRERGGAAVVVSLIGARADPQGLDRQAAMLQAAGAYVFGSNAAATRFATDLIGRA
jgi:FdrA protein